MKGIRKRKNNYFILWDGDTLGLSPESPVAQKKGEALAFKARYKLKLTNKHSRTMKPKELIKKWIEAFNEANADKISAFYHADAINHQVANKPIEGIDAIREMFRTEFSTAYMTCIPENIFEDGEWAILEWKDPLGLRGCGFFHITEGKIKFQRGYWDKLSFLRLHNLPIPE